MMPSSLPPADWHEDLASNPDQGRPRAHSSASGRYGVPTDAGDFSAERELPRHRQGPQQQQPPRPQKPLNSKLYNSGRYGVPADEPVQGAAQTGPPFQTLQEQQQQRQRQRQQQQQQQQQQQRQQRQQQQQQQQELQQQQQQQQQQQ